MSGEAKIEQKQVHLTPADIDEVLTYLDEREILLQQYPIEGLTTIIGQGQNNTILFADSDGKIVAHARGVLISRITWLPKGVRPLLDADTADPAATPGDAKFCELFPKAEAKSEAEPAATLGDTKSGEEAGDLLGETERETTDDSPDSDDEEEWTQERFGVWRWGESLDVIKLIKVAATSLDERAKIANSVLAAPEIIIHALLVRICRGRFQTFYPIRLGPEKGVKYYFGLSELAMGAPQAQLASIPSVDIAVLAAAMSECRTTNLPETGNCIMKLVPSD